MDFWWVLSSGRRNLGASMWAVAGCEHDKLVEFSPASLFVGSFITPIADVQEDEEDRNDED